MSKAKAIGTAAETAVVKYLSEIVKLKDVRRVVLHGNNDEGDIHVGSSDFPNMIIEVKSRKNECSYKEVEDFIQELETECENKWGSNFRQLRTPLQGYLVIKRPGKGKVEDWWLAWKTNQGLIIRCRFGDFFKPKED